MMIKSMTGYGRTKKAFDGLTITVEAKSVNHRFSEISVRMPRQFLLFEDKIKRIAQASISRGKVDIFYTIEGEGTVSRILEVDWDLMDLYYERLIEAKERFSLKDSITLKQLSELPDVFQIIEKEGDVEQFEAIMLESAREAIEGLVNMRESEGKRLYEDMYSRLQQIEEVVDHLFPYTNIVTEKYHNRLLEKIHDYLSDVVEIDETRIMTEVAIFADKSDISEELIRLKSHIEQFRSTLHSKDAVGRKLDFLVQEMNREMNTIGSKANDGQISKDVVELKSILEKIKEQVQNVE